MPPSNFNAHHSPMAAYLTFTCGHHNTPAGLAAQSGKPASQNIFIGIKPGPGRHPAPLRVLPFFDGSAKLSPQSAFTPEQIKTAAPRTLLPYTESEISRTYSYATDHFQTPDFTFRIHTPFGPIPDPAIATPEEMRRALLPAITAELDIDNTNSPHPVTAFFALNFHDGGCRLLDLPNTTALAFRFDLAFAAHSSNPALTPFPLLRFSVEEALADPNPVHLLGQCPGIALEVPPGQRATLRLALACYLPHPVTTRLEGRYLYTRYYQNLEDVLTTALARFDDLKAQSEALDQKLLTSNLSPDQQFLIAHATRSYYANTQLLDLALTNSQPPSPYWIVNEGEYQMMNTLDLAADHVFWELTQNPWLVRNLLDNFVRYYSYHDQIKTTEITENTETADKKSEKTSVSSVPSVVNPVPLAPGGISFTHDQGTHNQFCPFHQSAYELPNLTACFSFMTQEQLCNWILIAASYIAKTADLDWLRANRPTLVACLYSMTARSATEGGPLAFDSAMCGTGSEITTYDSLDPSLGRARGNLYIEVKRWAAYHGLRLMDLMETHDIDGASIDMQAGIENESLGRIIEGIILRSTDNENRILPFVEAFAFAIYWNASPHGRLIFPDLNDFGVGEMPDLLGTLRTHLVKLLADPQRRNHFPDAGIKLSSTSDNSWLSKIALVQHVARTLFHLDENGNTIPSSTSSPQSWPAADAAHVRWLTTGPGAYWCACDQIVNGSARGSKYYPRLITTALWLTENFPQEKS